MSNEIENNSNENDINEESPEIGQDERITKRQKIKGARRQQALVKALLIFGIIVFINIIAINVFYRFDLTTNKIYTLSDASKNLVQNLDDKLIAKAYFTDGLDAPYNNTRRYLKEILEDYRKNSIGNFQYEIYSPQDEKQLEDDAQKYEIPPVQIQTQSQDRAEARKVYMGVVFLYKNKKETIPVITDQYGNTSKFEFDITSSLIRLTQKQQKKVAVLSGPEMPTTDKLSRVSQLISKTYNFNSVDASKNNAIPSDISALLVFSPKSQQQQMSRQERPPVIPEYLKFAVDQYIMNGGKVIFLLDKVAISQQQNFQFTQTVAVGIEDMLESYGIKINPDIVKDKECAYVGVPQQQGNIQFITQIPFPYYPMITNINKSIPAFAGIGKVFLSFSTDLDTSTASFKGLKVTPILTTSPKSSADKEISVIMPTGKMLPDSMFKSSNLIVGSIYSGKFTSFYKGKQIPADTATGSSQVSTAVKEECPDTKVIVIGNGEFALDSFRGPDENLIFVANMIDYMTDDMGLTQIRLKDANPPPLKQLDNAAKVFFKFGMLIIPPVLVLVFGLWRWFRRSGAK